MFYSITIQKIVVVLVSLLLPVLSFAQGSSAELSEELTQEFKNVFKKIGMNTNNKNSFEDGTFLDLQDQSVYLSEQYYKGFQLVSFGATWCPPCREELPTLQILEEILYDEDAFTYHMVYVQEDTDIVQSFVDEFGYSFSHLLDETGSIALKNNVRGIPTTFLVDPLGNIVLHHTGSFDWSQKKIVQAIKNVIELWHNSAAS